MKVGTVPSIGSLVERDFSICLGRYHTIFVKDQIYNVGQLYLSAIILLDVPRYIITIFLNTKSNPRAYYFLLCAHVRYQP